MTLEDFFTLSELNNGLATPSRVTELVAIMEETDTSGKNVGGDLTRQWSKVASAITATDNKDCLDLFVQLDGLNFIAKWLNNAQRLISEESDSSIEDTITHLLQAVETFEVDREKLFDSELWTAVKVLHVHSSPKVRDKARVLFEIWGKNTESKDISVLVNGKSRAVSADDMGKNQNVDRGSEHSESSLGNTDLSLEIPADEEKTHDVARDEALPSATGDIVEDNGDGVGNNSDNKLDPIETEKTSVESSSPAISKIEISPVELTSNEEPKPSKGTSVTESSKNLCEEGSRIGLTIDADVKVPSDASGDAEKCNEQSLFHKSTSSENRWGDLKEFRTFHTGIEADAKVKRRELLTSGCDLANSYGLGKKHTTNREATAKSGERSDNDFDCGIVDPLDIARQVAIEVEREVGDYREQSCNSSEKSPENNTRQPPDSPESVSGKEFNVNGDDSNSDLNTDSGSDSKTHEESLSENTGAEQINSGAQDIAISQVTEGATTEINPQKILCDFDLNQVSSEDVENPTSPVSTPVSIALASRATTALELPGAPTQFDGNLDWKASASSAFRPSSPHRISKNEKETHGGESSGSKKREVFLDFDLNVAEDPSHHGESYAETNSRKTEIFPLDLNHATETSNGPPQDWLMTRKFLTGQSVQQHSPSSSKQPLCFLDLNDKPSLLNNSSDNSRFSRPPQTINAFGVPKPKETEFSIFGTKVEINAKDNALPQAVSQPNGRTHDFAFSANNMGQMRSFFGVGPPPMVQYTNNSTIYGYNNIQQSGPTMPVPSAIYGSGGPIPYMVDSGGSPVIPQIMGSGSSFPIPFSQSLPFVTNMKNSFNPPSNAAKSGFDLNSGSMIVESGASSSSSSIKDNSGFGQFLNLGPLRLMDENMRSTPQPAVIGQKRKEPENGWENYGLRPYTPPWK